MSHKHKKKVSKVHDSDSSKKHVNDYKKKHDKHCYSNYDSDSCQHNNNDSDSDCIKHHHSDCGHAVINCKQVAVDGNLCIPVKKPDMERIIHVKTTPVLTKIKVIEGKVIFSGHLLIFVEYVACVPGDTQPVHFASFKVPFGNFIDSKCHHNAKVNLKVEIEFQEFSASNNRTINKLVVIKVCIVKEKHCFDKANHIIPASFTPPLTEEPLICIGEEDSCIHDHHNHHDPCEHDDQVHKEYNDHKSKNQKHHNHSHHNDEKYVNNNISELKHESIHCNENPHEKNHHKHCINNNQHHNCNHFKECQYYKFYKEYNESHNRSNNNESLDSQSFDKYSDNDSNRYKNSYNNRYNNRYNNKHHNHDERKNGMDSMSRASNWNKQKQRYCINCGERIEYKAKYCGNCGRYVG